MVSSTVIPCSARIRAHPLPHPVAGDRVQPDGRLVEDQQLRPADQRLRELEPADHATGVAAREPVRGVEQVHRREGVVDAGGALAARHVVEPGEPRDVLPPGQRPLDGQLLGHVAEPPAHLRGGAGDVEPEDA